MSVEIIENNEETRTVVEEPKKTWLHKLADKLAGLTPGKKIALGVGGAAAVGGIGYGLWKLFFGRNNEDSDDDVFGDEGDAVYDDDDDQDND